VTVSDYNLHLIIIRCRFRCRWTVLRFNYEILKDRLLLTQTPLASNIIHTQAYIKG